MKIAVIALALVAAPVLAQERVPLSEAQQRNVDWMLTAVPGTSSAEAEMFLHVGQAKLAACKLDVRSRYCQSLAAMMDDLRAGYTPRMPTAAGQPQTPRPQARQ